MLEDTLRQTAAQFKSDHRSTQAVMSESHHDMKVAADYCIEADLLARLATIADFPVLAEESGFKSGLKDKEGFRWIVDPLDGSINFAKGIPLCCISVALWKDDSPYLGAIYDFNRDEMFSGIVGIGAWLNGASARTSSIAEKEKAILCTGFPSGMDFTSDSVGGFVRDVLQYRKVRLLGSAALSLAYVACGRVDSYREKDIKIWDIAAGAALVLAAGGKIRLEVSNKPNSVFLSASNACLPDNPDE